MEKPSIAIEKTKQSKESNKNELQTRQTADKSIKEIYYLKIPKPKLNKNRLLNSQKYSLTKQNQLDSSDFNIDNIPSDNKEHTHNNKSKYHKYLTIFQSDTNRITNKGNKRRLSFQHPIIQHNYCDLSDYNQLNDTIKENINI